MSVFLPVTNLRCPLCKTRFDQTETRLKLVKTKNVVVILTTRVHVIRVGRVHDRCFEGCDFEMPSLSVYLPDCRYICLSVYLSQAYVALCLNMTCLE